MPAPAPAPAPPARQTPPCSPGAAPESTHRGDGTHASRRARRDDVIIARRAVQPACKGAGAAPSRLQRHVMHATQRRQRRRGAKRTSLSRPKGCGTVSGRASGRGGTAGAAVVLGGGWAPRGLRAAALAAPSSCSRACSGAKRGGSGTCTSWHRENRLKGGSRQGAAKSADGGGRRLPRGGRGEPVGGTPPPACALPAGGSSSGCVAACTDTHQQLLVVRLSSLVGLQAEGHGLGQRRGLGLRQQQVAAHTHAGRGNRELECCAALETCGLGLREQQVAVGAHAAAVVRRGEAGRACQCCLLALPPHSAEETASCCAHAAATVAGGGTRARERCPPAVLQEACCGAAAGATLAQARSVRR